MLESSMNSATFLFAKKQEECEAVDRLVLRLKRDATPSYLHKGDGMIFVCEKLYAECCVGIG